MTVYVGADHGGFPFKQQLIEKLRSSGYQVEDLGAHQLDPKDDYPVFADLVAKSVAQNPGSRGVALCRSGHGMVMTANKTKGIRAVLATEDESWAKQSVENDDANVLTIGVDYMDNRFIEPVTLAWLSAEYEGGRHQRRLDQIARIEQGLSPIEESLVEDS